MSAAVEAFAEHLATRNTDERRSDLAKVNLLASQQATPESYGSKFDSAVSASGVEPVSIDWLWNGFVPLGALTLLYGHEGDGKSTLTMALAALATTGELDGHLSGKPANVEIIAYEDDPNAVLVPRLIAAGADLDRVRLHGQNPEIEPLVLPDDAAEFGRYVARRKSKLIVIDPLPDALREGLKDNNNADVRKALVPLNRLAQEAGCAVIGVTHPNKSATDAANKVMGSKAWRAVPRSVLLFGRDPDNLDGDTRIVAVSKTNYAVKTAVKVAIESATVDGVRGTQPKAVLKGKSQYGDADVMLANVGTKKPDGDITKGEQAERILYALLEDGGGEVAAEVAYAAGDAVGISGSTMRRAKKAVGATGAGGTWSFEAGLDL